jgi:hypothetical protein
MGSVASRRPEIDTLKYLWNACPGSLALTIYESAYTEWKLRKSQGEPISEISGFLSWLTEVCFILRTRI